MSHIVMSHKIFTPPTVEKQVAILTDVVGELTGILDALIEATSHGKELTIKTRTKAVRERERILTKIARALACDRDDLRKENEIAC